MKQDTYSKVLTGLFGTFLTAVMVGNLTSPAQAFSETENRTLAQEPEISRATLIDGTYMTDLETYLTDQFFARDYWVALKSTMEKVLMKQENNSVFFCANDTLINRLDTPDPESMSTRAGYFNSLASKVDYPIYTGLIPTAAEVWSDRLPANAPTADESAVISQFYHDLDSSITTVPLVEHLSGQSHQDLYYRSDHHWTSLGAYYGYVALGEAMGFDPLPLSSYTETVVSDSFFGTTYSTSGVRWLQPDSISTYVPEDGVKVTTHFTGAPEEGSLYVPEKLEIKDKYSYFLGGVQPLCIIETEHSDLPKLLLVRDSYSDSLVPFLTAHYSEIHLLDLRYYMTSVSSYMAANEMDEVLVLYSLSNFVSDSHLFKIGM